MAKRPELRDRFKLTINNLDPYQLGVVVAHLARIDVTDVQPELITDVVRFKNNQKHEVPGADFLLPWTEKNPTFRARDAAAYFKENGREPTSIGYALSKLLELGVIKKLDAAGHYARSDVKAIEHKPEKKTFDKPGTDVVLAYARRNHGLFNAAKITELFKSQGRAVNSVHAVIGKLKQAKLVKAIGEAGSGRYQLVEKKQKTVKKEAKNSGTAPAETTETANG